MSLIPMLCVDLQTCNGDLEHGNKGNTEHSGYETGRYEDKKVDFDDD